MLEGEHEARSVRNREQVRVAGTTWVLALPEVERGTAEDDPRHLTLDRVELQIRHSADERAWPRRCCVSAWVSALPLACAVFQCPFSPNSHSSNS